MKKSIKSLEEKIHIAKKAIKCEETKDAIVKEYQGKINIIASKKC